MHLNCYAVANFSISMYHQLIRGVKVRPMVHDQAKHKHGTYDLNNVGVEDGGATEAGSCKGKSPHRVRRSSQEAASMNQMAVST
jgi:hypothetical protein